MRALLDKILSLLRASRPESYPFDRVILAGAYPVDHEDATVRLMRARAGRKRK